MKIKYWLMVSYFIVMVLPLAAVYLLYASLSEYSHRENVKEYLDFHTTVAKLDPLLQDQALYTFKKTGQFQQLDAVTDKDLRINLYQPDGWQTYASLKIGSKNSPPIRQNKTMLFQDLNQIQQKARTYRMKQTVFKDGQLIGIYEVIKSRKEWLEAIKTGTLVTSAGFGIFFIALYIFILMMLNRKLNRPLKRLQAHMTAYAKGREEAPIASTNDEIGELVDHFEEMKREISETRRALEGEQQEKAFMIASLSHDLKTPLTVIQTYTEALQTNTQLSDGERKEYQEILFKKLEHMKQMIDDLSIYTGLQSSQNQLKPVYVHSKEFFEMLVAGYDAPCQEKDVGLLVELKMEKGYLLDPKQMVRVVDNLMDNSIRHTPRGGIIGFAVISSRHCLPDWIFDECRTALEAFRQNGTVLLIQNDGEAIPKEQLQHLFKPFYQADAARSSGATSGLGLSIAKLLVEKQGGQIGIWSVEQKGTILACLIKERGLEGS